jgi:hypothetical protein
MRLLLHIALAVPLMIGSAARAADPVTKSRQAPASTDYDHQCGIMLSISQGGIEAALAEIRARCHADDILRVTGAVRGPLRTIPAYVASAFCRFDQQIIFIPDGEAMICVYRGAQRDSRERTR